MLADSEILKIRPCGLFFELVMSKIGDNRIISLVPAEYDVRQVLSNTDNKYKAEIFAEMIQMLQKAFDKQIFN